MRSRRCRCGSLTRPTSKTAGEAESARPICCFWTQSWGGGEFRLEAHILSIVRSEIGVVIYSSCEILWKSWIKPEPQIFFSESRNRNSYTSKLVSWCLSTDSHKLLPIDFSAPSGWALEQRGEGGGPPAAGNGHMHKRKCNVVSEWHGQVIERDKCGYSSDRIC